MTPLTTTTELRKAALISQERLNWRQAARLWDAAADSYPPRLAAGALGKADVARMRGWAEECREMDRLTEANCA